MNYKRLKAFPGAFYIIFIFWTFSAINSFSQETKTIIIENADITEFTTINGKQASRLIGNVRFKHQDLTMTCDSAHYFPEENILDAFSNVHISKGDTLNLYGKFVKYRGNVRIAEVREDVVLIDNENHLTSDNIDYDMNSDIGYYVGGGKILNGENILTSKQGYYYSTDKFFLFKDSVKVTNPQYIMYSDTLKYHTVTEIAYFLGPTEIISDSNYIYCENGWYDTNLNVSQFNKNAFIESEGKKLLGDSLYYERDNGIGKAFMNIEIVDTSNNIILNGNKAIYYEFSKYAMVTDSALMIQIDKGDSLFIHADTIISQPDTIVDSRVFKAFEHVKIYRFDFQGKCDTLIYSDIDSIIQFHGEPVLWTDENQLTAQYIAIQTKNQSFDKIVMNNAAFLISMEDSTRFNQIKGRNMEGFFTNNELRLINVNGNGQTIYYTRDKNVIKGVNSAESSDIKIYLKNKKIERINFLKKPNAVYYPLSKFTEEQSKLDKFRWFGEFRPKNRYDVFRWDEPVNLIE